MAREQAEFVYHNIELYKSESLGSGSYGGVCKAKCDGLLCAAKIMHPTLFDPYDPGKTSYLRKFQEECHLLSLARHPNIVQYLATYCDPDTQLPVLLMELCDESLTAFLEQSPGQLSYHVEINICHDIALALVYLHSNGVIHRDLTGNNILMVAGTRAKITDFGMSKLATLNHRMTALTLCPGNSFYMPPEALDEAKSYTDKLDVFSFGVIIIQVLIRQYPNPTDRFRTVRGYKKIEDAKEFDQEDEEVRVLVSETERRQAHLQLIPDIHFLKPLAVHCLKKKEELRPSALQLSERLSELKQSPQYRESRHQMQTTSSNTEQLVAQNEQLKQQLLGQRILTEAKTRAARELQSCSTQLQSRVETIGRQLQEKQQIIDTKDWQLQKMQQTIEAKDRQLHENHQMVENAIATNQNTIDTKEKQLKQTKEKLRNSEQLVFEFQRSLHLKDMAISDLQQTISGHEREIQHLKQQQDVTGSVQQQQFPEEMVAGVSLPPKLTWREGRNAPERMMRGAAVVHGNTAYFRPDGSVVIYSYQNILGNERWSRLPDNPNWNCSLAVVDGLLTTVGGHNTSSTNTLLSLTEEGERKLWSEVFPPMPTPRRFTASITIKQTLVVAGGFSDDGLDIVEVMNIDTKQWTTVCPLPQKLSILSATACADSLYLAGDFTGFLGSRSVFTCSLPDLLQSRKRRSRIRRSLSQIDIKPNVWKEISSVPVTRSTLASFNGNLLAIGGRDDIRNLTTTSIYSYDSTTNSWKVFTHMKNKRSRCFALSLSEDKFIIVGGSSEYTIIDSVEILEK